jgi:hypothetical protein
LKKILAFVFAAALLFLSFYIYQETGKSKTVPEDIKIEAVLKPNNNERMGHKDVMLEVSIEKHSSSRHLIYPYIPGLMHMSFDNEEGQGFYVPTSIGNGPDDERKVADALRAGGVINSSFDDEELTMMGFAGPEEAGSHKLRMYFEAEDVSSLKEMHLVYVHKETGRFGRELGWTKVVKVQPEL